MFIIIIFLKLITTFMKTSVKRVHLTFKKSPSFGLLLKVYSIVRTRLNPCSYWLKS